VRVASNSSSDHGGCSGDFLGRLFVALSGRFSPGDRAGHPAWPRCPDAEKVQENCAEKEVGRL
jgi:hypothetical protein